MMMGLPKVRLFLGLAALFQFAFLRSVSLVGLHEDKDPSLLATPSSLAGGNTNGVKKVPKEQLPPAKLRATKWKQAQEARGLPGEYVLWSKSETYFEHCRNHYIGNKTWAQPLGPYVDKIDAKQIIYDMNIPGLKVPKTLAIYDSSNYTDFNLDALKGLPQPYIMKPAHTSGGVARVKDGNYTCFKKCKIPRHDPKKRKDKVLTPEEHQRRKLEAKGPKAPRLGPQVASRIQNQLKLDLKKNFATKHGELQYQDLPKRIIIEEDVMVGNVTMDVTYFYCAGGKPLFASMQCAEAKKRKPGTAAQRVFLSTDYQQLPLKLNKAPCTTLPPKPPSWDRQIEIATQLAEKVDGRTVRVDLYAGGDDVYFSEFTFTTGACDKSNAFTPRVADGLLYAAEHQLIDPSAIDSNYVRRVLQDKPWNYISLRDGIHVLPDQGGAYQSPVDMCQAALNETDYMSANWVHDHSVKKCLGTARKMATNSFRCMVQDADTKQFKAIGAQKEITLPIIIDRVDYGRVIILLVIVGYMTYHNIGTKHQANQYLNQILYFFIMLLLLLVVLPEVEGVYSGIPITKIVGEAFETFKLVHPLESPLICISHFLTYWFKLAAWRSKSLRNLLFFHLLEEAISAFFNEWAHLTEQQAQVRCMRLAFIGAVKSFAFDNLIREYIVPPFFVYGWLLPKFLCYWGAKGFGWVFSFFL